MEYNFHIFHSLFFLIMISNQDEIFEILDKVIEFEKAEKLNPPTERRAKQINLKELEKDALKLRNETNAKGIAPIEEILLSCENDNENELIVSKSMN